MVKSDNLANQLRSLGHQYIMYQLVSRFESVAEGLLNVADSVQLRVVRPLHSAIVAYELFCVVAVVAKGLAVPHANLRLTHLLIQDEVLCFREGTLCGHAHHSVRSPC